MIRFFVILWAVLIAACSPSAPGTYSGKVERPVVEVREALATIEGDALAETFKLPAATAGLGRDGEVVWNIFAGKTLAGQLQIKLSPNEAGGTAVLATYAPGTLSMADRIVPGLKDPKLLADVLFKALDARLTALDPNNSSDVVRRNNRLADDYLKTARTMANPTVVAENIEETFKRTGELIADSAPSTDAPDLPVVEADPRQAALNEQRRDDPAPKFGDPMLDPNKDR